MGNALSWIFCKFAVRRQQLPALWLVYCFVSTDFHRFYMIDKNRNPPFVFFVAVRTHKNQDEPLAHNICTVSAERIDKNQYKPLALDASLLRAIDAVAVCKSLSKLRDFQPAIPSPYGTSTARR